jgi:type I restriction enzyme M protein
MTDCNLHTILRLPVGTFTPYSTGVKANILFFIKGEATEEVWIYDNRTGMEKVTIGHPLTPNHFEDFETCYHMKPRKVTERFRRFTREEITKQYDDNLDMLWLSEEIGADAREEAEPDELVSEAITNLQSALDSLTDLSLKLANRNDKASGNEFH